ncbi:MAG: pilus assembly protein [Syntrophomonadaceae bacterium]|nr:pilus assembly protein [Syntrophomonadaceae bacterium]
MSLLKLLKGQAHGQALLEMALVLPILLLLLMGIIDFGRIIASGLQINNLTREAVRAGVVGYSDSEIEALIFARESWLEEDKIVITIDPDEETGRIKGDPLSVTIDYSVEIITPLMANLLTNPWPVSAQCLMRVE